MQSGVMSNDMTHLGPSGLISPKGGFNSIDGDSKSILLQLPKK